ncbi:hypothetical protein AB0K00_21305 [Dactylosporangium sp. NPDC049525]|uniref:hypothetical protein n=1 Tax=Dactylosporangium sp. NPDC049525 TaxID=3154730 RepID=UPI003435D0D0
MSTDLEQALRAAFRDAAAPVVPRPDPMRRLLQRRRRRWAGLTSLFAAVAVALSAAFVPALQFGSPPDRGSGDAGYPITSPWTRTLLDSPTRGSLGAPVVSQEELERELRRRGGDNPRLDRLKVLFLGDAGGRRFLAYARYNATHAALYYNDGPAGATAAQLLGGGFSNLRLDPLVRIGSGSAPALVGLVPAGCRFATAAGGTVSGNGVVDRVWTEAPTGSWIARDSLRPAERWRVTCGDGGLYFEGPAMPVDEFGEGADLFAAGGLAHGNIVQRWSGPIEGTSGTWTLTSTLLAGGGVAAVLSNGAGAKTMVATAFPPDVAATDTTDRSEWALASTAISSDPDVIAIRVPERTGAYAYYGEKVLVVTTTPGARSALVPAATGFIGHPLDNGVGVLRTEGGPVAIRNVADMTVSQAYVAERRDVPEYLGEKIVSAW